MPSIEEQAAEIKYVSHSNGYTYSNDGLYRTRRVQGALSLETTAARSKRLQREAGGKYRRRTDDGGHFIASRFNGEASFANLFAQNANFNRGAYRVMEDGWTKELEAGRKVSVDIVAHYEGLSTRPTRLVVTWYVDGKRRVQEFNNKPKGK